MRTLSYGRRKAGSTRLLQLLFVMALATIAFLLWGGPDGDPVIPPLEHSTSASSEAEEETATSTGDMREPDTVAGVGRVPEPETGNAADDLAQVLAAVARVEAGGDQAKLRVLLGPLVLDTRYPASVRKKWLQKVDRVNRSLVFSHRRCRGFRMLKVSYRDTYTHICQRIRKQHGVKVSPGMLAKLNGVPARSLRGGQWIKIPLERVSVVILKSEFRLYVLLGQVPLAHYPIGLGRNGLTPEGTFTIGGKAKNPRWTDPKTGKVYRYGEKGHLVGTRWMRFYDRGRSTSFGIHGTKEPESIGRALSEGCIRMHNRNVEELFDLVPEGTVITVRA